MRFSPFFCFFFVFWFGVVQAGIESPPQVQPFELPTFGDAVRHYGVPIETLRHAPQIDLEALHAAAVACFPRKDHFHVDLTLEGRARVAGDGGILENDGQGLGGHYLGLLLSLPIFSYDERDRERERAYKRRVEAGQFIARFMSAISERNHAIRGLGLYRALEKRSQIRVRMGVAPMDKQEHFLSEVLGLEQKRVAAEAKLSENKLALIGMCRDGPPAQTMRRYLSKLAEVTQKAKPVAEGSSLGGRPEVEVLRRSEPVPEENFWRRFLK